MKHITIQDKRRAAVKARSRAFKAMVKARKGGVK